MEVLKIVPDIKSYVSSTNREAVKHLQINLCVILDSDRGSNHFALQQFFEFHLIFFRNNL